MGSWRGSRGIGGRLEMEELIHERKEKEKEEMEKEKEKDILIAITLRWAASQLLRLARAGPSLCPQGSRGAVWGKLAARCDR